MTSKEALIQLRILNRIGVVNRKGEIIKDTLPHEELYDTIEHDLQILNLLARYCTFTDNTITFNATITDEHEIKLLKEWLNRE